MWRNKQFCFFIWPKKLLPAVKWLLFPLWGLGGLSPAAAQFAPAADLRGTTAIYKDDSSFVEWATGCTVQRGLENIADSTLGYASAGDPQDALGMAGESGTVSLGDGGSATLTFDNPVVNGPGFDFAVFENGFYTGNDTLAFLEYAFVEVSSDGERFVRFPAISNTQDTIQVAMEGEDCSAVNNLAGKYVYGYGTPFNLDDVKDSVGLDVNHITQIRIVDVVGSIDSQYATRDINGRMVNDPWPTPFASSGFDLDAVGVINMDAPSGVTSVSAETVRIYPNPVKSGSFLHVMSGGNNTSVFISDINGRLISEYKTAAKQLVIPTNTLVAGVYFLQAKTISSDYNFKLIVQ